MNVEKNQLTRLPAALMKLLVISIFLFMVGCGGGGSSSSDDDSSTETTESDGSSEGSSDSDDDTSSDSEQGIVVSELIANAYSGTSIGLSWEDSEETYSIYRDGELVAETTDNYFVDESLSVNTEYSYWVGVGGFDSESGSVTAKTLVNNTNDGFSNGTDAEAIDKRIVDFDECQNERSAIDVDDDSLDSCLQAVLDEVGMAEQLEDMRAFAARVRSEQDPAMVELGMRLFHSKSLSANGDTACSSCHHPTIGCAGDDLSMSVGVNAVDPDLLGPGRSDGENEVPLVARNAQPICNVALWDNGLFWDNRVLFTDDGSLKTDSRDVTNNTEAAVGTGTLALMMAQAHFPVTDAAEMGDISEFGYDESSDDDLTDYREEYLIPKLNQDSWGALFTAAYGDSEIDFSRIAEAIAAYEGVYIFIDNPFFDYVDGDLTAIDNDAKRGAITYFTPGSGCTACHTGAFFTNQGLRVVNYPQIGIGKEDDGADWGGAVLGGFRVPTLLNAGITGPWGHAGQFGTLERNIEHYAGQADSVSRYFADSEMCDLDQFAELEDCAEKVAPDGLELTEAILEIDGDAALPIDDDEVGFIAAFLEALTDPDAENVNSSATQSLIPPRDGGPDGMQLDAWDEDGNEL
ncbi:cytochrome-c peroxidase [Microbulbifer sp. VAAF005]|uniref:cytochrome-c peroxidase n=1 Tax=Microbulbifer sp. VAAF005 TaxID=3034230 RepID=UPI0024AE0ACA|nr:cytochrome-c peroxidase [Microbulbifer sp. VAAF005]WHI48498.1 cytochrome-c peroxidase [Microbulbifer sp. VAAF005]